MNVLIPIFVFTESVLDFSSFLILSVDWLSFGVTVSLYRNSFFPHKTSENSFFLPPVGAAETAVPLPVNSEPLVTDGATCLAENLDLKVSMYP